MFDVINHIACDCAHDPTAPPDCFPGILPTLFYLFAIWLILHIVGTQLINIGVHRFYAGLYQQAKVTYETASHVSSSPLSSFTMLRSCLTLVQASSIGLTVYENTVPPSIAYLDVDINICYSSQFRISEILTTNVSFFLSTCSFRSFASFAYHLCLIFSRLTWYRHWVQVWMITRLQSSKTNTVPK